MGKTVFVVIEDIYVSEIAARTLKLEGFNVQQLDFPQDIPIKAEQLNPDLILIDHRTVGDADLFEQIMNLQNSTGCCAIYVIDSAKEVAAATTLRHMGKEILEIPLKIADLRTKAGALLRGREN